MPQPLIDTSDIELSVATEKFLSTKKASTSKTYRSCLKRFVSFYGDSLESFITKVEEQQIENRSLPAIQRKRYADDVIREWIKWMEEIGYSPNAINQALAALQNFMQYYSFPISYRFIERPPPRPLTRNEKHQWSLDEIKQLVDSAHYVRDKAVFLCLFQSGLSIGDLVNLDYGDVRKELEERNLPALINLYRRKTGTKHKTFFGRDAVYYLNLYLKSRLPLADESPLFTMLGSEERVTEAAIQAMMRRVAEKLDFIDEEDLNNGYNPARPHSLRAAFNSRLTNKMDRNLIEFFMGHEVGEESRTYLKLPDEELRELYASYEHLLSFEKTSREELEGKKEAIKQEDYIKLDERFTDLARENMELKQKIEDLVVEKDNLVSRLNGQEVLFQQISQELQEFKEYKENIEKIVERLELRGKNR